MATIRGERTRVLKTSVDQALVATLYDWLVADPWKTTVRTTADAAKVALVLRSPSGRTIVQSDVRISRRADGGAVIAAVSDNPQGKFRFKLEFSPLAADKTLMHFVHAVEPSAKGFRGRRIDAAGHKELLETCSDRIQGLCLLIDAPGNQLPKKDLAKMRQIVRRVPMLRNDQCQM